MQGVKQHSLENQSLLLATYNAKKAQEISALLQRYKTKIHTMEGFNLPEPEETGKSFAANALLKAHSAWSNLKEQGIEMACLADDSGLAVDALDGAPGIYSARWAGEQGDYRQAMTILVEKLRAATGETEPSDKWGAQFVSVIALVWPDGESQLFEGVCKGHITWPMRGENGFGYDPIFCPTGETRTFAEMHSKEKQAQSHRGKAFERMIEYIESRRKQ